MAGLQSSKLKVQSSNKAQGSMSKTTVFDLEERMTEFGETVITFCRALEVDHVSRPIVSQLIRSATGIGANYAEANNASSKKDFRNKAHIAKKECQETKHWLRMLIACYPGRREEISYFWQEAHEFILILQSITNKIKSQVEV